MAIKDPVEHRPALGFWHISNISEMPIFAICVICVIFQDVLFFILFRGRMALTTEQDEEEEGR